MTMEEVLSDDREDGFIPANLIPFAEDMFGNGFYCDQNTENVFFYPHEDIDNPEFVCEKISDFFDNLKVAED